ncbi:DUF4229 domain-containing protein [Actinoallomurus purpureus]|uniref:DUF4229 domain-containing protein n=1 Tax=Actinoallomurus purpureus TaxID=478114 RepID=UPI0020934AB4|nr:DUF4229 domain-containing protein [Actinoallomurus purpureus]MCO6004409.1 DUF4229 domain-containing protein [Actinoallomurus purpureus]
MRSVFFYTVARLALFGATAGVLFLTGARGFLLLALAILISGVISFVLLSRQRDAVSASVTRRAARMRENLAAGAAREDGEEGTSASSDAAAGEAEATDRTDDDPQPATGSPNPASNGRDPAS